MPEFISKVGDLTDDEILRAVKDESKKGVGLCDPLEASILLTTGRSIVSPEDTLFDDIRRRFEELTKIEEGM
tara:strand:+ start:541 stop:756 length:216 start_codon:yes stop_codon:yes gene_type:complete